MLGYQCPFIPNFVAITRPLTALLKKDNLFIWTPECVKALNTLIKVVTSSSVLVAPDQDRQFELEVDASQYALGAILWQRDPAMPQKLCAIGYYSKTLAPAEMNYKIHDRELLAVICALCHWSHLLRTTPPNQPIIIWTDHKNLTYWSEPQKVGPCATTWQVELQQYNFELCHKPGESNKADALSCQPDYNTGNPANEHLIILPRDCFVGMPPEIQESMQPHPHLDCAVCELDNILAHGLNCAVYKLDNILALESDLQVNVAGLGEENDTVIEENLDNQVRIAQDAHYDTLITWMAPHSLTLSMDNYLYKNQALIVVENNSLRRGVTHLFHNSLTAGHPGISKTIDLIEQHYWWPHMRDFITAYVKGCATCQMNKVNMHLTKPPLFPITPTSDLSFQTIAVDFITKLPPSQGYNTILTVMDHDVSKASIFIPCHKSIDSEGVAKLYTSQVFPHYGIPLKIISDRDTRFNSAFTKELC
jgi:RNase H-like domain found in reverse transcriptase/Integrase zinc binding domain